MTTERLVRSATDLSELGRDKNPYGQLRLPGNGLDVLISPKLREATTNGVEVVRYDYWHGRLNQEYQPELSVLIVERGGLEFPKERQEAGDSTYPVIINGRRTRAIERGLISLVANDGWHRRGVEVISLVLAEDLRGQGVGYDFYDVFEDTLDRMGYGYVYGENDRTNIGFFLQRERYHVSELVPVDKPGDGLIPLALARSPYATIKFFDRELEEQSVKPEFLRAE
jgi:GNAT superfamily N-acetyltransferase